jgi:hypothetical protein
LQWLRIAIHNLSARNLDFGNCVETIPNKPEFAELEIDYDSDSQHMDFTFSPSSDRAFDSGRMVGSGKAGHSQRNAAGSE